MHHLYAKCLLILAVATLHACAIHAQYNDDTTPRKVHLEDLEVDIEEKESDALNASESQNQRPYEILQVNPTAPTHFYQQNLPQPAVLRRPVTTASTENNFNFAYNSINDDTPGEADTDVDLTVAQQQPQQQHWQQQHQQSFYMDPRVRQALVDFVLVPKYNERGISAEQNYATSASTTQHPSAQATTLAYKQQQPTQQQLLIAPAGVHYLTSNALSDVAPTAPTFVLIRKPALEYGVPDAPFIRQSYALQPQQQLVVQSNQFAYAPKRAESNSLAPAYATIPFPPSFVSITTTRPSHSESFIADFPVTKYRAHQTFKPSQPDPVPDFFANRQAKSLLESYIPSWVIAKMVQQRQSLFNRNTLARPFLHRNYKRASGGGGKDIPLKKRSVKKSLPPMDPPVEKKNQKA